MILLCQYIKPLLKIIQKKSRGRKIVQVFAACVYWMKLLGRNRCMHLSGNIILFVFLDIASTIIATLKFRFHFQTISFTNISRQVNNFTDTVAKLRLRRTFCNVIFTGKKKKKILFVLFE